jgi:hypothetical protein
MKSGCSPGTTWAFSYQFINFAAAVQKQPAADGRK